MEMACNISINKERVITCNPPPKKKKKTILNSINFLFYEQIIGHSLSLA